MSCQAENSLILEIIERSCKTHRPTIANRVSKIAKLRVYFSSKEFTLNPHIISNCRSGVSSKTNREETRHSTSFSSFPAFARRRYLRWNQRSLLGCIAKQAVVPSLGLQLAPNLPADSCNSKTCQAEIGNCHDQ